jgi:hypothetical protein
MGRVLRETIFYGDTEHSLTLKVLRQCPFVLPVKIGWREGKALRNEEGKALGNGFYLGYKQRKDVEQILTALDRNFEINLVRIAVD